MTLYPSCPITSCNHLCESNLRQSALSAPFCNAKLYAARALPDFCRYLQNGGANNGIVLVLLKSRPPWSVLQGLVCQFINFHYPSRWKVKRFDSDLTIAISMDDATARLKDESNHISLASKCLWIEKMFGTNTGFFVETTMLNVSASEAPGSAQKSNKHVDVSFSYVLGNLFHKTCLRAVTCFCQRFPCSCALTYNHKRQNHPKSKRHRRPSHHSKRFLLNPIIPKGLLSQVVDTKIQWYPMS